VADPAPADGPFLARFSGFADVYDAHRPSAPPRLGALLARYAGAPRPEVVDLGSGTGLSTRWAAGWARHVTAVEPNDDMRAVAIGHGTPDVEHRAGTGAATGLPDACADVVVAVQAMHWMEPTATLAEAARILRPGGVFATVDADWPPVTGLADAEAAWVRVHAHIRVFESRLAAGETGAALRREVDDDDPALVDEDPRDPHLNRAMLGGRSWPKREHLANIARSGWFASSRELVFDEATTGGADRFVALLRSQGSYQGLRRAGLTDDDIGVPAFEAVVADAYRAAGGDVPMSFCWRVRLGVRAR
jgi:SAM-dependent methyltransferase